jgi:hypothetical protein
MSLRGVASRERVRVAGPHLCYARVMNTQKIGAAVLVLGALAWGCGGKSIGSEGEHGGSGGSSGAGGSSGTGTGSGGSGGLG